MSHAVILVALSDVKDTSDRAAVHKLVAHEMEPFYENGEWGGEGTRWDWWVIGGRWTGHLMPGYDPRADPRNIEPCRTCGGVGIRPGGLEQFGPAWFDGCNGCNGCQGKGTEVKWTLEPCDGDIMRVNDLNLAQWSDKPLSAYGFVKNRVWHERARMGLFAMTAASECEIAGKQRDGYHCVYRNDEAKSKIVNWNDPSDYKLGLVDDGEGPDKWQLRYVDRFIKPLARTDVLVVVDFHV